MEFNCLLFPCKKNVNIDKIAAKVVLIPHEQSQSHIYYLNLINPAMRIKDSLTQVIQSNRVKRPVISVKEEINKYYQIKKAISQHANDIISLEHSFDHLQVNRRTSNVSEIPHIQLKTFPISDRQAEPQKNTTQAIQKPSVKVKGYVPCLFLPGNSKFILYFHGNAEDIKSTSQFLKFIHNSTGYSVFAMQYQGYSVYQGSPSSEKIQRDIRIVMSYLMGLGLQLNQIFVIGRSIGSGPALSLVSQFKVSGILLVSPFLSICKLVKDRYGSVASFLMKQRFQNYKIIEFIQSPIMILHGSDDTIVPCQHSQILHQLSINKSQFILVQGMTHMTFDFRRDFIEPLKVFLSKINF